MVAASERRVGDRSEVLLQRSMILSDHSPRHWLAAGIAVMRNSQKTKQSLGLELPFSGTFAVHDRR